jgi:hypothetical protein
MNQLNQIEPDDIKQLGPDQMVRLLDLLLHAEAKDRFLLKHGIHVPFQITVPDGGRDGKWDADIDPYEYIPKKLTYYQSKAQTLTDGQCRAEILRTDEPGNYTLKEKVKEVMEQGGAYVFFSSHPCVAIDERIAACRKALHDAGRPSPDNDCIEFLDANKIAKWVNLHISAFAYVCQYTTNFQAVGLKNVEAWGQEPIFSYEFQLNDYLADQIRNLRQWLVKPGNIARITGPSGLGKTRLGYEVFSCKSIDDNKVRKILYEAAAYADAQVYGQQILGWVDQLCGLGFSGIIVVDNCSNEWHHQLALMVKRGNSKLSLLTLDYVPESVQPDILHIELNPQKLRDIVPKILKSVPELAGLQDADRERISGFAQGFPQIAILTAKAGRALDLRDLNYQNKLADRLLWGRDIPDQNAREFIRCLALFSHVGASGNQKKQLDFVRDKLCNGVSEYDFNRATKRFRDKRIIQTAGDFIMVVPPPLAVALAAEWLADAPDEHIFALLPEIAENRLTQAFCDQLHKLDFSERATELSKKLLGADSPLSLADVLNSEVGSQIFRALSELNPLAATECLYRVFASYTPEQCRSIVDGRRNIIWALEKLCWPVETFPKAATVLLAFAAGENETYGNSATEQFKQLFHVFLSGTKCPPNIRLEVIRPGLKSPHIETKTVCIEALGAALVYGHFSRTSGAEVRGTQLPEKDWEPKLYNDIWDYWREAFNLLKEQILESGNTSQLAIKILGNGIGALLGNNLVLELEKEFKAIADFCGGYWPEAREQLNNFLSYNKDIPDKPKEVIKRWLSYVQPKDLKSRFLDIVSLPGWDHEETEQGTFIDVSARRAEEFAEELFKNKVEWEQFIPMLLQGEQRQAWYFGAKCAKISSNPKKLIEICIDELRSGNKETQNTQLLRGMLSAIADRNLINEVLEQCANDDSLVHVLVQLTTAITPTLADFDRVATRIKSGRLVPLSLHPFAYGSVTSGFDDTAFSARLKDIISSTPDAAPAVLQIINLHCHLQPEKLKAYQKLLEHILLMPSLLTKGRNNMISHYWQDNTNSLLNGSPSEEWVANLTRMFIQLSKDKLVMPWTRDNTHGVIHTLLSKHTKIAWPIFCEAFKNAEKGEHYYLIKLLTDGGSSFENHGSPIWGLPANELKSWAEENPDLVPGMLHFMSLFVAKKGESGHEEFVWHPHALLLLPIGNIDEVIGCVHANLASFGSSGSRIPYLEKRIALLKRLPTQNNQRFLRIAETIVGFLQESLDRAKKQDEQFAAGIY